MIKKREKMRKMGKMRKIHFLCTFRVMKEVHMQKKKKQTICKLRINFEIMFY